MQAMILQRRKAKYRTLSPNSIIGKTVQFLDQPRSKFRTMSRYCSIGCWQLLTKKARFSHSESSRSGDRRNRTCLDFSDLFHSHQPNSTNRTILNPQNYIRSEPRMKPEQSGLTGRYSRRVSMSVKN
jgi:hypothetical protein